MDVWKFGCNWGGNENSFYKFIRDESIVIGYRPHVPFRLDDLVLITRGFTVLAMVEVEERPRSITESDYGCVKDHYGIEWSAQTIYARAEWYEFPAKLQFQYRVQRGSAKVGKEEIISRAKELWGGRK